MNTGNMWRILMAPNKDPKGGGGGGDDNDDGEDNGPSEKDIKNFNVLFHKASAEREKRFKKDLLTEFDKSFSTKMDELKTALAPKEQEQPNPGQKPEDKGTGKLSSEAEAMIRQAQKDAADAKATAQKYQKEAEEERQRTSRAEERQMLVSALSGKVKPTLLDMVVDQLHQKHVTRDPDTKAILWKNEDGEMLPYKDGAEAWTKSEIGKEFSPPKDVRGTGRRAPGDEQMPGVKPGTMTADILGDIVSGTMGGPNRG